MKQRLDRWGSQAGSLTVEALLFLPVLFFYMLFMIALVQSAGQLLSLDRALTAAVQEMTAASYALQQGSYLLAGAAVEDVVVPDALTKAWAEGCLQKYLKTYTQLKPALVWKAVVTPHNRKGNTADDVLLCLEFCPAKVKAAAAAWLPQQLTYTLVKQQKAWLIGKELLPYRGLETVAGTKKTGPLVFITRWGTHYHQENCRYLVKSKIACELKTLAPLYLPCSLCQPAARN